MEREGAESGWVPRLFCFGYKPLMKSFVAMKIAKEELKKLISEANYQEKAEYEDRNLNDLYNCWCFFEEKEFELQKLKNIPIDSILYSKYYWCTRYKDRYERLYGFDAGVEQQQYKIIEELQLRLTENIDWNLLKKTEEE